MHLPLHELSLSQSYKVIYFTDPVDLHVNDFKNSSRIRADSKQNLLNTFIDKRKLITTVIPLIIFVALLRIELSYIRYASQRWKIVLLAAKKRISS